jgi:hypothetical protein
MKLHAAIIASAMISTKRETEFVDLEAIESRLFGGSGSLQRLDTSYAPQKG